MSINKIITDPTKLDPFYIFDVITKNKAHHVKAEVIRQLKGLGIYEHQLKKFANPKHKYCSLLIDDHMWFHLTIERMIGKDNDWRVSLQFIDKKENKLGEKIGMTGLFHSELYHRYYIEHMLSSEFHKLESIISRNKKFRLIA